MAKNNIKFEIVQNIYRDISEFVSSQLYETADIKIYREHLYTHKNWCEVKVFSDTIKDNLNEQIDLLNRIENSKRKQQKKEEYITSWINCKDNLIKLLAEELNLSD